MKPTPSEHWMVKKITEHPKKIWMKLGGTSILGTSH
jgi:hypothetical protein